MSSGILSARPRPAPAPERQRRQLGFHRRGASLGLPAGELPPAPPGAFPRPSLDVDTRNPPPASTLPSSLGVDTVILARLALGASLAQTDAPLPIPVVLFSAIFSGSSLLAGSAIAALPLRPTPAASSLPLVVSSSLTPPPDASTSDSPSSRHWFRLHLAPSPSLPSASSLIPQLPFPVPPPSPAPPHYFLTAITSNIPLPQSPSPVPSLSSLPLVFSSGPTPLLSLLRAHSTPLPPFSNGGPI